MTGLDAVLAVVDALAELNIPYMMVGSFAANQYGIIRSTADADFVVELGDRSIHDLAKRLGPAFRLNPQMSFETVTGTSRHELAVTGSLFRVELFQLSRDAYDQERFQRRVTIRVFDRAIWFLTPEDVILTKLRWSRLKDRQDIANVLAVQADRLDWTYIARWAATHETQATLDEIRASLSPMGNQAEEV